MMRHGLPARNTTLSRAAAASGGGWTSVDP